MFAFTVARRYLLSNPAQTALLVAGVALGVTAFVFITALIQGLAVRLTNDVTANSAHISLEPMTRVARVLPSPDADVEAVAIVSTFQRRQIRAWASTVALCAPSLRSRRSAHRLPAARFWSRERRLRPSR